MAGVLSLFAVIILLGIASQIIENRTGFPRLFVLILAGFVLGPLTGEIAVEHVSEPVRLLVMLAVAIIVFEGSFRLELKDLPLTPAMLRLVIIGPLLMFFVSALLLRFVLGVAWTLVFLVSSLLIATGPTITETILADTQIRDTLGKMLEAEGVINDVTAEMAAVAIFEVVVLTQLGHGGGPPPTTAAVARDFVFRMGAGILIGGVLGIATAWYFKTRQVTRAQTPRLIILVTAISAFTIGELVATEVGVVAAVTAGLVVGNSETMLGEDWTIPHEDRIEEFEGDLTAILLGVLFIILAALVDFRALFAIGLERTLLVVIGILALRPVAVWLATWRLQEFSHRKRQEERVFLSALGPRGIIPASLATLFSLELVEAGFQNGTFVAGFVFLMIFASAIVAYTGKYLPGILSIIPDMTVVVGGGRMGWELATNLEEDGEDVVVIENDAERVQELKRQADEQRIDVDIVHGDGTDQDVLDDAYVENAQRLIAVTGKDDKNLLACLVAGSNFDIGEFYARVNDPANRKPIRNLNIHIEGDEDGAEPRDLDITTVSPSVESVRWLEEQMVNPGLREWLDELDSWGDGGDWSEVEVSPDWGGGRTLDDLLKDACDHPGSVVIPLITTSDGDKHENPPGGYELQPHDKLTILGDAAVIEQLKGELS